MLYNCTNIFMICLQVLLIHSIIRYLQWGFVQLLLVWIMDLLIDSFIRSANICGNFVYWSDADCPQLELLLPW